MFSCLCRKPEEDEENKGADNAGPLRKSETGHYEVITSPEDGRDLPDTIEVVMSVLPTDPWFDGGGSRVDDHGKNCQRGGERDFRAG